MKRLLIISLFLGLGACQPMAKSEPPAVSARTVENQSGQGSRQASLSSAKGDPMAFAQAACGGCHSVEGQTLSPNPSSPSFYDIANRPGITQESLSTYFMDAHNYPEQMDFDLEPQHIEALTRLILDLRDENYKLPAS